MQVLARSTTSARPRTSSPRAPVSDCGIPSPTTMYGRKPFSSAMHGSAHEGASSHTATRIPDLSKGISGDVLVAGTGLDGFTFARLPRRIRSVRGDAIDLREHSL